MSYGVKYRLTFSDDFPNNSDIWENITQNWESYTGEFTANYSWKLDLLANNYSGSITSLTTSGRKATGNPLSIIGSSNDDDPLSPILPTEIMANFFVESLFEFDEILSGDERTYQFKLYLNDTLELIGWITPDGTIDFYADTPYPFSVRGLCGLSQLKGIPYDNDGTAYTGKQTLLNIISNCLAKIGFENNFYTAVNFWEENMDTSADMLGQVWIDAESWIRDGETMSCYDVLSNIALRCNSVVFQREGKWYFVRIAQYYQDVDNILRTLALEPITTLSGEYLTILGTDFEALTGFTRYEYTYLGVLAGTDIYKPNVTAGGSANFQLRAMNRDQTVFLRQPWKKASLIYDHDPIPNIVIDGGFEPGNFSDSGTYLILEKWQETGTLNYEGVFQTDVTDSQMGLKITTEIATEDVYESNYLLNLFTNMVWTDSDQIIIKFKFKFIDVSSTDVKWYYTLRMTNSDDAVAYFYNGATWSITADFSATVQCDVIGQQTDYELAVTLPTAFNRGNFAMQLHGVYDGINLNPKIIIDNMEVVHYDAVNQISERGEFAEVTTATGTTPSVLSIEGSQNLVTGEGRTNYTKGAWLMNLSGTLLPAKWARGGRTEEKTLDEINLQSIMNIRYFGNKIIEGTYRGYARYGDVIIHDAFDNRYFMVKKFNFNAKMRKGSLSMHEIKDIDTVTLTYDTIIE